MNNKIFQIAHFSVIRFDLIGYVASEVKRKFNEFEVKFRFNV